MEKLHQYPDNDCVEPSTTGRNLRAPIYAIRVIDGNATLLTQCATNPTIYCDVQNASELNTVFSAIAQNLANLRLAK